MLQLRCLALQSRLTSRYAVIPNRVVLVSRTCHNRHMCQHTEARPAVQAASSNPLLARLCGVNQLPIEAVHCASAALFSIAVLPDFKVRYTCDLNCCVGLVH